MKIILPKPPTTNHYYGITSRGRFAKMYITKEGKEWQRDAEIEIKKQYKKKTPITAECEVWINLFTSTRRDADGSIKPVLDILQSTGIIENDALFYGVHAIREKCKKGEDRVEVEIMGY